MVTLLNNALHTWISVVTIPTYFTLLRILLVPFIVRSMLAHDWVLASILFIVAALTDIIDGALARFLNQVTLLGSLLDPLADKLLLISSFACLTFITFSEFSIPQWFLVTIIVNELILTICAVYWGLIQKSLIIKPTRLGKMTGFGQVQFISWIFLCGFTHTAPLPLFYLLLMLMLAARACTLMQYAQIAYTGKQ